MRIAFLFATMLAVVLSGCGSKPELKTGSEVSSAPVAVSIVTAAKTDWPSIYEATGTVHAKTTVQISARVMAYVRDVRVSAGDPVRAGQTLVTLDAQDLEARERQADAAQNEVRATAAEADQAIQSAKVNLELAQTTFRRMKELFDKRSLSNQEFDEASARVRAAQASFDMAQARRVQVSAKLAQTEQETRSAQIQRGYSLLASPVSGVVTAKNVEPGNLAVPGAALLTIEREGGYRFEAAVEESHLSAVRNGQSVNVTLDALAQPVTGTVTEIVPAVDPASRSGLVKIDLPGAPGIRSGLFGKASFSFGSRTTIVAPANAVSQRGQMSWVFVARNGRAEARIVTLGERRGDQAEVLSGLAPEERLIAPVPPSLADGSRIEVR